MATVSLQAVFDSARRALETGAADKAIGIAQHILVHFPRMIEGHRLLGEAYLNANEPEQAVAAFEQVLHADPENVAAYYGLGLAQQSLDQRPAAIAAFERALEIQPNLADLRTQLMRLYSETPGSAGQFRLSRAGLGRLYARGGMFGQAIDEFRAVLDSNADRDDVKVALAEALWRDNQEDEATDFCRDVRDRRPDLVKPTVLLGYMLFAAGQPEGEALWRRAAEQDASMAIAHSLFDILPPIRLEEPVLPEFEESEWRAQIARRAAEQPLQPSVAAVANDDDFFADSWLSSTGTAPQPSNSARIYDSTPTPAPSFAAEAGGDDDLLASLLGFADAPAPAARQPAEDFNSVAPFGLDDWATDTADARQSTEALPPSLGDLGLADATPSNQSAETDSVKPFSFDDWSFDDDTGPVAPKAEKPASQGSGDFDFAGIEAFSFDDDAAGTDTTKPFSFEADSSDPGGVMPFSLEDEFDEFGGVEPFAMDAPSGQPASSAAPAADAGLGAVQPFSLDEWGLDDNEPSSASTLSSRRDADDDLGDFKPFSLDELSLDSLDSDPSNSLSGPQIGDEAETGESEAGFSWEEPSWRTQRSSDQSPDSQESESIFAKLMRSRPQDPPPSTPVEEEPLSLEGDEPTFFSLDEEPLRLDLDADTDEPTFDQFNPAAGQDSTAAQASSPSADTQPFAPFDPTFETSLPQDSLANDPAGDLLSGSFNEPDQVFSWDEPVAAQSSVPLSEQDTTPFSLSDLGFSDDELAELDLQPAPAQESTSTADTADTVDMTPFSLADLGLSDDELAALDLQDDSLAGLDQPAAIESAAELPFEAASATSADPPVTEPEVDMTPFSLADLGLSDEELALLTEQDADETTASFDELASDNLLADSASFAEAGSAETLEPSGQATPADEVESWFDLPATANAELESVDTNFDNPFGETPQADQSYTAEAPSAQDQPADTEQPSPFSLADLGLSDDELALFEQIQSEQTGADADVEDALAEPTTSALTDDVAAPSAEANVEWPFAAADTSEVDAPVEPAVSFTEATSADMPSESEFTWPFSEASTAQPEVSFAEAETTDPVAETEFAWPFAEADTEASVVEPETSFAWAEPAEDASEVAEVQAPVLDASTVGDESVGAVLPTQSAVSDIDPQALPADLPEGAQSVAATTAAQPVVVNAPATVRPSAAADSSFAAIHAQLAADPENHAMRLAVARMSQHTSDVDQAVEQYKQLIKRGELLDDVVDDLQDVIGDIDDPQLLRRLHRLLGDAYMKQNRFREAMDEYSWTLARRS